jgi:Rod binding domain-containing protein
MQFEAVLLQNMIEAMMPEDDSAVYGSGTAGSVWKSMMAEKVATEIARTGRLGIAKQIAAGEVAAHPTAPTSPKANDA